MISTSTNSQEGQTYVALSCGISDLEGNATGVSISIDMVERRLLVLFIAEEVVGVCVCGLCSQDSLRQSRVAAIGKRQILQLKLEVSPPEKTLPGRVPSGGCRSSLRGPRGTP